MTAPRSDTRLDLRALLAGAGALLLLISLFLDWYGDPQDNAGITGWDSFEIVDVILAALALSVLYELARSLFVMHSWPAATLATKLAGPVALVLVVVSMIDDPPVPFFIAPALEVGIWLAFAGALLMTAGALLGRVRISVVAAPQEPAPRPPVPPHDPDTETRPLP